ncbi:Acyltransferase [Lactobacillus selangorensis]|uniref:Acyltransferase n=1 Tax=Lactobacillus selangorensis TaxID=81857 RepID=A0A0R2FTX7_9LACO|nr:acyltransferase [Lactobacillus selangorensis]KRN28652.1 Acyltransferase [Lactobacillus selangorensis]KRN32938.1 Acyltransferase [Lactobacillus selangorensis]
MNTTPTKKKKKPYLYEVDLMRVIFIFGVLLNHTTSAFAGSMGSASWEKTLLNSTHLMLHFTRMGFMFMTGLVLFLNYYHRPEQNWWAFWKKRYTSVGIPYLAWNAILVAGLIWGTSGSFSGFWSQFSDAVIHGNRFYLYYVFVTFQLYLIFPLMIWLFKKTEGHHIQLMVVSFLLELLMLFTVKYGYPHWNTASWPYIFRAYGLNVLIYEMYFMAGAYAAIHYKAVLAFLKQHSRIILGITAVLSLGTIGLYWFDLKVLGLDMTHTETPQQPYIMIYALFMVAVVFIVGLKYAQHRARGINPKVENFIHMGARVSFGIYLVQTIPLVLLDGILGQAARFIPDWGLLLLIPIGYAFVLGGSYLISLFCYYVWPFGWLIGRPQKKRPWKGVAHDKTNTSTSKTTD